MGKGRKALCLRRSSQGRGDAARRHDRTVLSVGLVIALDLREIVAIVDHQAVRLAQPLLRSVGKPVEPLESRTVAEMKARHGIDGPVVDRAGKEEIVGGK